MTRTAKNETDNKSRGAIAVEFALVAPLLLALITGVVEFANIFNSQITVTQAAREAARTMAVKNSQTEAKAAAVNGAPGLVTGNFGYSFSAATCTPDATVKVTISYPVPTLTGLFGSAFNVSGVGAMRCNG